MSIKFFISEGNRRGEHLARNFKGAAPAKHGDPLADVNLHYGILYGGSELYERCKAENKTFVHVDHAFWGRPSHPHSVTDGLVRFSRNSQANSMRVKPRAADYIRLTEFEKQGLVKLMPRRSGPVRKIVYQPPSDHMREHWNLPDNFDTVNFGNLRKMFPAALLIVAPKGLAEPEGCDLFVSFNSGLAFKALELGIDILMTAGTSLWPCKFMSFTDESLFALYDERIDWETRRYEVFAYMAGRTFSLEECANGIALDHMLANGELA